MEFKDRSNMYAPPEPMHRPNDGDRLMYADHLLRSIEGKAQRQYWELLQKHSQTGRKMPAPASPLKGSGGHWDREYHPNTGGNVANRQPPTDHLRARANAMHSPEKRMNCNREKYMDFTVKLGTVKGHRSDLN